MESVLLTNAKQNLRLRGYLEVEIDPTLDLFEEIKNLKSPKMASVSSRPLIAL